MDSEDKSLLFVLLRRRREIPSDVFFLHRLIIKITYKFFINRRPRQISFSVFFQFIILKTSIFLYGHSWQFYINFFIETYFKN